MMFHRQVCAADDMLLSLLPDPAGGPAWFSFEKFIPSEMENNMLSTAIEINCRQAIFNSYVSLPDGIQYEIAVT